MPFTINGYGEFKLNVGMGGLSNLNIVTAMPGSVTMRLPNGTMY